MSSPKGLVRASLPFVCAAAALGLLLWGVLGRRTSPIEGHPVPAASEAGPTSPSMPVPPEALAALKEKRARQAQEAKAPTGLEHRKARIEASQDFTEPEKDALRAELEETTRIVEEAERRAASDAAANARDLDRATREKAQTAPRDPVRLRLSVDLVDAVTVMPCRPLVANLRLINEGEREYRLTFSVAPEHGALKAEVRRPGAEEFSERTLTIYSGSPAVARTLAPGGSETYQTDIALELGAVRSTRAVLPGLYTVRLSLPGTEADAPVTAEFSVTVVAPGGQDRAVLDRILLGNLQAFLGTKGLATGRLSFAKEDVRKAVTEVESLCRDFPDSAYAADLRVGAVLAMQAFRSMLAPSPEAALDLHGRAARLWSEIVRRDLPKSWARAEILPLLVLRARGPQPDLGGPEQFFDTFRALCPGDPRSQR